MFAFERRGSVCRSEHQARRGRRRPEAVLGSCGGQHLGRQVEGLCVQAVWGRLSICGQSGELLVHFKGHKERERGRAGLELGRRRWGMLSIWVLGE